LLAIGVANGSMMAINVPSRQSLVAEVVPRDLLMNAISLNNSAMNLARITGPALAGVLIVYIDTWGVFYIISLSYMLSALFMLRITPTNAPRATLPSSFIRDIRQGFNYLVRHSGLRAMMLILLFSALCQFGVQSLLPVWAKQILHAQSDGLGYLVTTSGVGALVGSLFIAAHSNIKRKGLALIAITGIAAASTVLLAVSSAYGSALPILFVNGLTNAVGMSLTMTLIQIHVDEKMRGRVLSISMMTFSLAPLGVAPMGAMAERFGTPAVFATVGLGLMVFILLFVLVDRKFSKL
jgi:predicted MFS family arabinose efflux permease